MLLLGLLRHPIAFCFSSPTAKSVQIAGDFNAWGPPYDLDHVGNTWSKTFDLPSDARLEYKLVVDGNWILDPSNPLKNSNGLGGENSVWQGPKYRFSVHDGTPHFPLIRSELVVSGRTIVVFAPANSKGLPLLVYGDGPSYEAFGKVQNVVENLAEAHKIRPAVIVLVPPIDRMKEYGEDWKSFGSYLLDEVLPAVRTATGASLLAENVFLGGSSLGGLISLRLAEEFPDKVAGGIHCQSAAIQFSPLSIQFSDAISREKLGQIAPSTRLWFDWGTFEDTLTVANVKATKTLKSLHRRFGTRTTHEGHNWTAWRNRMESGLIYLLRA